MPNYNQITLLGNLTRDIELRYTPKGVAVGQCAIAVNRHWTTEDGEKKEEVTFIDFKVWNKSAETMAQYVKKGNPIMLVGRLSQERWDDKTTGEKKSKHVVVVESFQFLGTGKREEGEGQEGPAARPKRPQAAPQGRQVASQASPATEYTDDDVPF